jgi:hypothetical protein
MSVRRRFKTWNIFDSALIDNANGHHYWETKALVDELVRRGETVRLFSHLSAPPAEQFPGVPITPVFSLFLYGYVSNDPTWGRLENFILLNRAFAADLAKLDASLFQDSLVLFPTILDNQFLGVVRWLRTFPEATAPKAAICLMPPVELSKGDHTASLYKTVWKDCEPELKKRTAIFGRTAEIVEVFAKYADLPARVFPHPVAEQLAAPAERSDGSMVVSFVGGAREQRGAALVAEVVKRCSGLGVRFFVQARRGGDSNVDEDAIAALAALPYVEVYEGALPRNDYYRAIAGSVVLLPYHAESYRFRDSGVYHEAKFLDAPALVSAGTSMADEVTRCGNGLVIEDFTVEAIVDCIVRAERELPALRAAAARVGKEFRDKQGVGTCLDAIAGAFE